MSRSGYDDDLCMESQWRYICWRGAVKSAIRGKRGQQFLKELRAALEALPEKKLIAQEFVTDEGAVCALGAVGKARELDMSVIDTDDDGYEVARRAAFLLGIPRALAAEIIFMNDEAVWGSTPEARWQFVHNWVVEHIKP